MSPYSIAFFVLFFLLFYSSQLVTKSLTLLFHGIFNNQLLSIRLLAFLFFPGVVIHEFAHALMAHLLFVPVGKMEFLPVMDGDHVKLGSVQVGKADPVRRMLIGIAPIIAGLGLLGVFLYYFMPRDIDALLKASWRVVVLCYGVFIISNTMFSSRKDLEGMPLLLLLICVLVIIGYFLGIRIPGSFITYLNSQPVTELFGMGSILLGIPLAINTFVVLLVRVFVKR